MCIIIFEILQAGSCISCALSGCSRCVLLVLTMSKY